MRDQSNSTLPVPLPHPDGITHMKLEQAIVELEEQLADLHARLPAHSIPPTMIAELDRLDEQLASLRAQLATLGDST